MENWQSEYLQFSLFILGTIWLLQRGSPESKELDEAGLESDQKQQHRRTRRSPRSPRWARAGGLRTFVYSNSLLIVMTSIFFGSWFAHSVTGWSSLQRRSARAPAGRAVMDPVSRQRRLLAVHLPELAVGVPRRRARWRSCPCICASAAHPSPSRWARHTTQRESRARSSRLPEAPRGRRAAAASRASAAGPPHAR